jgi:hypothetical protein
MARGHWWKTSMKQGRALLSLAINRIVLVPWPGGDTPRREPGRRRELQIEWTPGAKGRREAVLVAEAVSDPELRHCVSDGRAEDDAGSRGGKTARGVGPAIAASACLYKEWNKPRSSQRCCNREFSPRNAREMESRLRPAQCRSPGDHSGPRVRLWANRDCGPCRSESGSDWQDVGRDGFALTVR